MNILYKETYPIKKGDFDTAGSASSSIKRNLKKLGIDSSVSRDIAIASYELEMNLIIHSLGGELIFEADSEHIVLTSSDTGPGIEDIELAMKEGYSTAPEDIRMMGFGAGMGLPNIKRHSHELSICSDKSGTCIQALYKL
jgi:anti-sigma regulatory factor (Ser/Thr protein kinase)